MGGAIGKAAADLKRQLAEYAAELLEVSVADLLLEEGRVTVRGSPSRSLTYGEIALRSNQGNLIGRGAFSTRGGLDLETGQGIGSVHWHQGAIGCEVEVDVETGKIKVLQLAPVVFAGRVVNPRLCELQLEGCAVFGFGQALFEEMTYGDHGQLQHPLLRGHSMEIKSNRTGTRRIGRSPRRRRDLIAAGHGGYRQCGLQRRRRAHSRSSS